MSWKDSARNRYRVGTFHNGLFSEFKVDKLPRNRVFFKGVSGVLLQYAVWDYQKSA